MATTDGAPSTTLQDLVFERCVVGIDGSPESHEAARQAAVLLESDGQLVLLAAWDIAPTLVGGTGMGIPTYYDEDAQREAAGKAVQRSYEEIRHRLRPYVRVVRGRPSDVLIGEAGDDREALIAVGSHGTGRMRGILLGSTASEVVHKAPCSVLVARGTGAEFSGRIVVGIDGSPESGAAYATAHRLALRSKAELWPVVAHGGKGVDEHRVELILDGRHEDLPDEPVRALVAAAADADLVVVGSRGLHGVKSLGSVSERVAHQARSSVLVIRHGDPVD